MPFKRFASFALVPLLVASASAPEALNARSAPVSSMSETNGDAASVWLTPEQIARDIALAEEAFSRVHPGYTRYAAPEEMAQAWAVIRQQAKRDGGMSVKSLYLALARTLTTIRCDHTAAQISRAMRQNRKGKPLYLPFRWRLIEGRGVVETRADNAPVRFGDEILEVDGRPLADMVAAVSAFIPVDGYTEWSRANEIAQESFFMGGGVDHFAPFLWDVPAIATLTVKGTDGAVRKVEVERTTFLEWMKLGDPSQRSFNRSVTFTRLGDTAGYLSVNSFVNYLEPVKPKKIFDPIFKAMKKEGRTALILDLRKNGGGTDQVQFGLLKNLINQRFRPTKQMYAKTINLDGLREHLFSWNKSALKPSAIRFAKKPDGTYRLKNLFMPDLRELKPTKHAFEGDLYVLIGPDMSSGSTNILASLREMKRGVMIGAPTGGNVQGPTAGQLFTLTLPESGLRATLPFYHVMNNVTQPDDGLGITPDISAPMTLSAFRAGRDPALEKAKALAGLTDL